jgi:hypothetical protein
MISLKGVFDNHFKFAISSEVRHKGDKKEYGTHDMGLFIVGRFIEERLDDSEGTVYKKIYHCRMIRFSGSGDIAAFAETELQSVEDWRKDAVKEEVERNMMRDDILRLETDILKEFGIKKSDRFKIVDMEETKEFRMNGFKTNKDTGKYEISVRQTNTLDTQQDNFYISDPKNIILIKD